jgi:autotransporter-associated beta strand protein
LRDVSNIGYWNGTASSTWDTTSNNFCTNFYNQSIASSNFSTATAVLGSVTFADSYNSSATATAITNGNITITAGGITAKSLIFANNAVNYNFSGGNLSATAIGLEGSGTVTFNNTTSFSGLAGSCGLVINALMTVSSASLTTQRFSGNISGTGGITTTGGGTLVLSGTNTYAGLTNVTGGTLVVIGNQSGATGGINVGANAATFENMTIGQTNQTVPTIVSEGSTGISVSSGAGGTNFMTISTQGNASNPTTVTNSGPLLVNRDAALTIGANTVWNQSGAAQNIVNGGYGAGFTVASGATFNYTNSTAFLDSESGGSGQAAVAINGVFNTSSGINLGPASGTHYAQLNLYSGGTLGLTANSTSFVTEADTSELFQIGSAANINSNGYNGTIGAIISNYSSQQGLLNYTGPGSLSLTATNTYTGGTNISNGTLTIAGTAGKLGSGTVNIYSGGTLAVTRTTNFTFNNALTGAGGFTQAAPGEITTYSGTANYSGPTNISGGALNVTGNLSNSAVTVYSGGALTGAGGTINGPVTVNGGGLLDFSKDGLTVGGTTTTFNLSGGLALGDSSGLPAGLTFNLNSTGTDLINASTLSFNSSANATVNVNGIAAISSGTHTYTLMTYGSESNLSGQTFTLGSVPPGVYGFSLINSPTSLQLQVVAGNATPITAYWTGNYDSSTWSGFNSTTVATNFSTNLAGTIDGGQLPGSITDVVFSASPVSSAVNSTLGQNFTINSLTFASGSSVSINGSSNTLTIQAGASNTGSGSLGYAAGTGLVVASSTGGAVNINVGNITLGASQNWVNNSAYPLGVSSNVSGTAATGASQTLTLGGSGSGNTTLSGTIGNGSFGGTLGLVISPTGTGSINLGGNNTFGAGVTVSSGTVNFTGSNTFAPANGSSTALLVSGGNATFTASNNITGINVASGSLNMSAGNTISSGLIVGGGTANLSGNNTITGGVTQTGGTLTLSGTNNITGGINQTAGNLTLGTTSSFNGITLNGNALINGPTTFLQGGQAISIGSTGVVQLGSAGALGVVGVAGLTLNGSLDLHGNSATVNYFQGGGTLTDNGPTNGSGTVFTTLSVQGQTFSGNISSGLQFVKNGSGALLLNNPANNYSGGTILNQGIFYVWASNTLGTGTAVCNGSNSTVTQFQLLAGTTDANDFVLEVPNDTNFSGDLVVGGTQGPNTTVTGNVEIVQSNLSGGTLNGGAISGPGSGFLVLSGQINVDNPAVTGVSFRNGNVQLSGSPGNPLSYVQAQGTLQLGASGPMNSLATLNVASAGTANFDLNGFNQTLTGLIGTTTASVINTNIGLAGNLTVNVSNTTNYSGGSIGNDVYPGIITASSNASVVNLLLGGPGTFTLTNAGSTFLGDVNISGGTLVVNAPNNNASPTHSALGNPSVSVNSITGSHTIWVGQGATLEFAGSDTFGSAASQVGGGWGSYGEPIVVNGGLIINTPGSFTSLLPLTLNGGTLATTGGNGYLGTFNSYQLPATITVGGSSTSYINASGGSVAHPSSNLDSPTTFDVAVTNGSSPSLIVSVPLTDTAASGAGSLVKSGLGAMVLAGSNTYTGLTDVQQGTLTWSPSGTGIQNINLAGGLTVETGALANITAAASPANRAVMTIKTLSIAGATGAWTSTLDLANNDAIVSANGSGTSIATITNQLAQGYNGGAWNGNGAGGIISTAAAADTTHLTALGVLLNDNGSGSPLVTTFDGQTTGDGDVLIKYTYYGDALLTGSVTSADYGQIDNGFLNSLTGWQNGDFDYDGVVNGSDYTLIDNAFNQQGATLASEITSPTAQLAGTGTSSAVPEPASLGLIALGTMGLLGRRSKRR